MPGASGPHSRDLAHWDRVSYAALAFTLAGLVVGVGLGLLVVDAQHRSATAERIVVANAGAGPIALSTVQRIDRLQAGCRAFCGDRMTLAGAVIRLRRAERQPLGPQRDAAIGDATRRLEGLTASDPDWSEPWVWLAQARDIGGVTDGGDLHAIARSYDREPFSRRHALWRMGFVNARWDRASPALRRRTLDEAVWLGAILPPSAPLVTDALSAPPAALALVLRRKVTLGDDQPL